MKNQEKYGKKYLSQFWKKYARGEMKLWENGWQIFTIKMLIT